MQGATRKVLEGLRDKRKGLLALDELATLVDEILADLPHLVDRELVVLDHETPLPKSAVGGGGAADLHTYAQPHRATLTKGDRGAPPKEFGGALPALPVGIRPLELSGCRP